MALWPFLLIWGSTLDLTPTVSFGASILYSRRECVPFWGLALSVSSDYCSWGPTLFSSAAVSRCGQGGITVLGLHAMASLPLSASLSSLARLVWGFPFPPQPHPFSPITLFPPVPPSLPPARAWCMRCNLGGPSPPLFPGCGMG